MDAFDLATNTTMLRAAWVSLILCGGTALVLIFYAITNTVFYDERPSENGRQWRLIIGTLRDSFLITISYVIYDLIWKIREFSEILALSPTNFWGQVYWKVLPYTSLPVIILMAIIAVSRLQKLQKYLET